MEKNRTTTENLYFVISSQRVYPDPKFSLFKKQPYEVLFPLKLKRDLWSVANNQPEKQAIVIQQRKEKKETS